MGYFKSLRPGFQRKATSKEKVHILRRLSSYHKILFYSSYASNYNSSELEMFQMNVKTSILNGEMDEEISMKPTSPEVKELAQKYVV